VAHITRVVQFHGGGRLDGETLPFPNNAWTPQIIGIGRLIATEGLIGIGDCILGDSYQDPKVKDRCPDTEFYLYSHTVVIPNQAKLVLIYRLDPLAGKDPQNQD
jgi:hypothetical protein